MRLLVILTTLFPLWAVLGVGAALAWPGPIATWRPAIVPLLGLVMFGMGLTLAPRDFVAVAKRPAHVALGTALQFAVMPLAGWLIGMGLGLPRDFLVGLVLVGACPGGTASNVICYLARGDVALSITLTTVSTLLAVILTPALTWLYIGEIVPVPVVAMLLTILKVILAPVAAGVVLNRLMADRLGALKDVFPLVSVGAIVVIIAIVVALNAGRAGSLVWPLVAAVVLHNATGLAAGYGVPRLLGLDARLARTIAIEVGMQNSGLGVALATQFFSAAAALPGAVFSVWHNLSGAALAALWSRRPVATETIPR